MDYATLKSVHQSAVALSIAGFCIRSIGVWLNARWVRQRLAKTLPHIVDTVLLLSAIALAWQLGVNPLQAPWLLAKIGGLLVYIGLGMVALRATTTLPLRALSGLLALCTFAYIASVALSKNPLGFFRWI